MTYMVIEDSISSTDTDLEVVVTWQFTSKRRDEEDYKVNEDVNKYSFANVLWVYCYTSRIYTGCKQKLCLFTINLHRVPLSWRESFIRYYYNNCNIISDLPVVWVTEMLLRKLGEQWLYTVTEKVISLPSKSGWETTSGILLHGESEWDSTCAAFKKCDHNTESPKTCRKMMQRQGSIANKSIAIWMAGGESMLPLSLTVALVRWWQRRLSNQITVSKIRLEKLTWTQSTAEVTETLKE